MAEITAAFGSSHSIMLAARREDWIEGFRKSDLRLPYFNRQGERITFEQVLAAARADAAPEITTERISTRFDEVQAAMAEMKRRVEAAPIDVLVIVGDDQYELFHDQHMPAIGIYYGETIRNAKRSPVPPAELAWYDEARMRRLENDAERHYACHRPLARALIEGLVEREFDVAAMASLGAEQYEGHAYSFVHRWYLSDRALPIVPIFVNTYNPPNPPTPRRCVNFGRALKAVIESYPEPLRVGVMASGGLSHFIVEEDLDLQALGVAAHLLGLAGDALRVAVALDAAGGERADPLGMLQQVVEDARLERLRHGQPEAGVEALGHDSLPQR